MIPYYMKILRAGQLATSVTGSRKLCHSPARAAKAGSEALPTALLPIDLTTPLIPRGPSILRPSSTPVIGWECCYGGKLKYPGIIIKGLPVANKSNFNFIRKLIIRIRQIQRGYHPCIVQDVTMPSQPHDATHELGLLSMRCQQPHAAPTPSPTQTIIRETKSLLVSSEQFKQRTDMRHARRGRIGRLPGNEEFVNK